jgi:hypothetical protein
LISGAGAARKSPAEARDDRAMSRKMIPRVLLFISFISVRLQGGSRTAPKPPSNSDSQEVREARIPYLIIKTPRRRGIPPAA